MYNTNTPLFAYFLGWMYADGSIYHYKIRNSYTTKIKVQNCDQNVLDLFISLIKWNKSAEYNKYTVIRNHNKEFALFLISIGCLMRKSYENSLNLVLPSINKELYPYFIRGLFDGDGSYYTPNKTSLHCVVANKNYTLLKQIQKYLDEFGITSRLYFSKNKCSGVYKFIINKNIAVKKFLDLVFHDNLHLVLDRKYQKVHNFLLNYSTVSEIISKSHIGFNMAAANTRQSITKRTQTRNNRLRLGLIKPSMLGRKHTEETKKKMKTTWERKKLHFTQVK